MKEFRIAIKRISLILISLLCVAGSVSFAQSPLVVKEQDAFIEGLREINGSKSIKGLGGKSASHPRTLSPVVSRFKGWFIDVTEKAKPGKLNGDDVIEGISLASESRDTSFWQFVETEKGYLVRAAAGRYKDWIIVSDDSAKPRPEGPNLTVAPALRLAKNATVNCYWKLTLAKQGLVLEATSGKYKGWFWDFGGGDPSHKESGREVAVNVLLAERVVAGSYFEVKAKK
ncbi:MAG: hypothetical protein VYA80_07160 [Pseudomonadota bacterium]|nr:hypothetical protein [Pseudomonadota bacterium]